jgi:serine/threonine protein kinase
VYRGIDTNSHDICLVYEWKLLLEKNKIFEVKKLDTCLSEFKKIEEELRKLIKLSNNNSLFRYLAYKAYKQIDKPFFIIQVVFKSLQMYRIYVFLNFKLCLSYIEGNSLDIFLNKKSIIQFSTLQTYTTELIKILDYLHSNYIYHRDLKVRFAGMKGL